MSSTEETPDYPIVRVYLPTQTLGSWYGVDHTTVLCKTMELPWRNNARSSDPYKASCLPEGRYLVTWSAPVLKDDPTTPVDESGGRRPRPYEHFIIHGTAPRQGCLVHRITNVEDLLGCIGVGQQHVNLDKDADYEIAGSTAALEHLVRTLPKRFYINITNKYGTPYKLAPQP